MHGSSSQPAAPPGSSAIQRVNEWAKFLPVTFVSFLICGLYTIYMVYHCIPKLREPGGHGAILAETVIFNVSTFLLLASYILCIAVSPGSIPAKEEDPSWEYVAQDGRTAAEHTFMTHQETKRSGDRRHCKWCAKYKPDRCHHCRVCRTCILKMDHHCPWIYNCVGFGNHKYFFLLLLYSTIDCHLIAWTMLATVKESIDSNTAFMTMFLLLFGETLAIFLGLLLTAFFLFHIWLMLKAMTTIEFCEKSTKRAGYDVSIYDRGLYGNIRSVLGDQPLLWLLPLSPPSGKGLYFTMEDTPLARDLERGQSSRQTGADERKRARRRGAGTGAAPDSAMQSAEEVSGSGYGSASPSDQELVRPAGPGPPGSGAARSNEVPQGYFAQ